MKYAAIRVAVLFAVATLAIAVAAKGAPRQHERVLGFGQISFDGAGPERWAQRARRAQQQVAELRSQLTRERRVLFARPSVTEAINLAAATYGFGATLWRKAGCETGGTFSPRSLNGSSGAAGLFQFLPSTWATTPYAAFSIWSPYANALAAAWMHAHGRGGEWVCG